MGQLFFTDQNGRRWMCGWDNPTQGYYAFRENDTPDPECFNCPAHECRDCHGKDWQEFDVLIGFGNGVSIIELDCLAAMQEFKLTPEQLDMLESDRARDIRPLTPLQQRVHAMFEGLE